MQSLTLRRTNLSIWTRVIGIALFAVATAISARVTIPLAFSPVPLTLQVLVVLMAGLVLGPRDAFLSQVLYLQAVLLGAPLTAYGLGGPAAFVAPTAGYLWAFPFAAATIGWFSMRATSLKAVWRTIGGVAAMAIIYSVGALWLSTFVGGFKAALIAGVVPFLAVDGIKVVLATALAAARDR